MSDAIAVDGMQSATDGLLSLVRSIQQFGFASAGQPNAEQLKNFIGNGSIGDNDLFTVSAGKKAFVQMCRAFNSSGFTAVAQVQAKIGGTYFKIDTPSSIGTQGTKTMPGTGFMLEAGETLSINVDRAGVNLWVVYIEFDDTTLLKRSFLTSLASGDNTVYTVPAGKKAIPVNSGQVNAGASVNILNFSGGSRAITVFIVPSGGSTGTANKIESLPTITNSLNQPVNIPKQLEDGESVVVNTNAATAFQGAYMNYLELPA